MLLGKSKKDFYNNPNVKRISDNRKFWQTMKPNFTDKTSKMREQPLSKETRL